MSTPNLTLYGIETQLLELLNFRDELLDDRDMEEPERAESLKAADAQIAEYVKREVQKVDAIAAMLREFEKRAEALRAEADRIYDRATKWERRHDGLEALVKSIMVAMNKPRLDGKVSTLKLNKSPASVTVPQPDLLPANYQRVKITMTLDLWQRLKDGSALGDLSIKLWNELLDCKASEPEPIKDAIKAELKAKRGVPGARLVEDNQYLKVD